MLDKLQVIRVGGETILSFVPFGGNRDQETIKWHKLVMQGLFDLPMNYIQCPFPAVSHGACVDWFVNETIDTIKPDYYFICDNDNIFLTKKTFEIMYNAVSHKLGIWSAATQSNHKKGPNGMIPHAYASQASLCFPTSLYLDLGKPSFDHYSIGSDEFGGDTCERLTYLAKQKGYMVSLLYPSHSNDPNTDLDNGCRFGRGNTYGPNLMYHQMQNDNPLSAGEFICKCEDVLNAKFL